MPHAPPRPLAVAAAIVAAIVGACAAPPGQAADDDIARRVERLEQRLAGHDAAAGAIRGSGLVEVEAFAGDDFAGNDASDIELATVELGAEAELNDYLSARTLLLFEEGTPEDIVLDEGALTLSAPGSAWSGTAGRFYVPFGVFDTALISDTLVLELAETRESALQVDFAGETVFASLYTFNGDTDDGGDERIEQFGLGVGVRGGDDVAWRASAGYLSSLGDSDGLALGTVDEYVGGLDLHARAEAGAFTLMGEYVTATDAFAPAELGFGGSGAKPAAWQAEAACGFTLGQRPATASVGVQGTDEAVALGLPATRALIGLSVEAFEATTLAVEFAHDEDYDAADGGTGNSADTLTFQLAAAF